jgi:glucosamine-6-phosphate deaminase
MDLDISPDFPETGLRAGRRAATLLRAAITAKGYATLVVATGASQYVTLDTLVQTEGIRWDKVEAFHLDEYVGISESHPASFRRYLRERFTSRVPHLATFHAIHGDAADIEAECRRLSELLGRRSVDVGLIGIGENGHLAFNDPPADFFTKDRYHQVRLDEACQRQQVGEGWFPSIASVPKTAISMTVPAIMSFNAIVCTVPDKRKAIAIHEAIEGHKSAGCPASILRDHHNCTIFLDRPSASLLSSC